MRRQEPQDACLTWIAHRVQRIDGHQIGGGFQVRHRSGRRGGRKGREAQLVRRTSIDKL